MIKRKHNRKIWKKFKKLESLNRKFDKPKFWYVLKQYENRKRSLYLKRKKKKQNNDKSYKDEYVNKNKSILELPCHLDFEDNIDSIELLLNRIDTYLKVKSPHTRIDISKLNTVSINGLIFLLSEIDKIQSNKTQHKFNFKNIYKYNPKYGVNKDNEKLKFLLYKIGYWNYFGIKKPYKIDDSLCEEYFLSIKSDTLSHSKYVAELRDFISKKIYFLKDDIIQDYFDDAISEAMANSVEHGYIDKLAHRTIGKWWLCGHYDKQSNYLEFSFRDYGVGLRRTLEYNSDDKIKSLVREFVNMKRSDSDIIQLLVNDKLPKYKNNKNKVRGYGFKKFKEFAKNIGYNCEMKMLSGSGKYKFIYNNESKLENEILENLNFSIDGFLITWKIYLDGGKNEK